MNVLLIPTDFSENATNALEYATETANALGAQLIMLHVYNPPLAIQTGLHAVLAEDTAKATKLAHDKLAIITKTINQEYPSLPCSFEIVVGDPVSEILGLAKLRKVDMIVMGTQGASRVVNVIFGSNTASIIEKSECPVLCIPFSTPFKEPQKIVFATNFQYSDIMEASKLVELARVFNASILLAHIVVGAEETEDEKEILEKFTKEVKLHTGYDSISGKVISDAAIHTGLDLLIEKTKADVIVLSTHKRSFFQKFFKPSLTTKFSYYTTIPLLAFHSSREDFETESDF